MRRTVAVGITFGLGFGLMAAGPAFAHHSDDDGAAWGLNVAGDDGPAWGLTVTGHGPAWGVRGADDHRRIRLPVVLDGDTPGAWGMGVSAFGIDDASITGDNPVADAYLGQSGFNSVTGWNSDRRGWLGGLLGDEGWGVVGGRL